ncbi:hypothetical protein L0N33_21635, partial [Roseburia faecis]|nr:hypothetical protein [Roseburia faecis]
GTFDSPGMNKTIRKLGQNGTETLVPCSSEHFAKMIYANAIFPDITLFDLAFHRFAHLSKNYLDESIMQLKNADVVVFSHPWSYPLL